MSLEQKLHQARREIEELSIQIAEMLGAALYFAGVPEEKMIEAIEAYVQAYDEVFEEHQMDEHWGYEDVIKIIEHLKKSRPQLFSP